MPGTANGFVLGLAEIGNLFCVQVPGGAPMGCLEKPGPFRIELVQLRGGNSHIGRGAFA